MLTPIERVDIALRRIQSTKYFLTQPDNNRHYSKRVESPFLRNYEAGLRKSEFLDIQTRDDKLYKAPTRDIVENKRLCPWKETHIHKKIKRKKQIHKRPKSEKSEKSQPIFYKTDEMIENELYERLGRDLHDTLTKIHNQRLKHKYFGRLIGIWYRRVIIHYKQIAAKEEKPINQTITATPIKKVYRPYIQDDMDNIIDDVFFDEEKLLKRASLNLSVSSSSASSKKA